METMNLSDYEKATVKTMFEHLSADKLSSAILVLIQYYNEQYGKEKAAELIKLATNDVNGKKLN